ncbi:MAG: phosphonate metabolism protein PhnM [Deltaproteobacteria bacterium]|nr:phosphonate metabolism protein PhnM [Deltaproteobacteria bacterium]
MATYLTHATIILSDQMLDDGSLLIEDGAIAAINPVHADADQEIDLHGAFLMPGLIDLHCDALEKEVEPRPNVYFPIRFALREADKRNVMAGITTPFHALSFAGEELGVRSNEFAAKIAQFIHSMSDGLFVDHRVHCRYEITDLQGLELLITLIDRGVVDLISFMDHTPGQGQFRKAGTYETYLRNTYKKSVDEAQHIVTQKQVNQPGARERVKRLAEKARHGAIPLASHDDDSPERIQWTSRLGVCISEFPINLETAQAAKKTGVKTMFGAPNILRGQSQSGSMLALDGVEHNVIDVLCSDYHPGALLPAVFRIAETSSWTLPEAVALVTRNPAQAAGMHGFGSIEPGKRADLIAVHKPGKYPRISSLWVNGRIVWTKNLDEVTK